MSNDIRRRLYRPSTLKTKSSSSCMKNSSDCMYLSNGSCTAEWCIYEELPKITNNNRELTCYVCGKNKKTVSIYSGTTSYVCPECQEKINKITQDEKLCSVCNTNKVQVDQYICSECQEKLVKSMKNDTCCICGSSTSIGKCICDTCANKIKEKINE